MKTTVKEILGREETLISYASPEDPLVKRIIINSIELSTGRRRIEKAYQALKTLQIDDASVWSHVFPLLDIELSFNQEALEQIPKKRRGTWKVLLADRLSRRQEGRNDQYRNPKKSNRTSQKWRSGRYISIRGGIYDTQAT